MKYYLKSIFFMYIVFLLIFSGCNSISPSSIQNTPTIAAPTATATEFPKESSESVPPVPICSPYSPPKTNTSTNVDAREVIVTNATIEVNGNTNNMDTLVANPGADGISFREAIIAGNNTPGPKLVTFSPEMKGSVIQITEAAGEDLSLRSGQFTIDGDIDGDDNPDITLDGSRGSPEGPSGIGIVIVSSYNTITGMIFKDFQGDSSILFACTIQGCADKIITGNKIIGNTITSQYANNGIRISPWGRPEDLPEVSGIIWQDTLIQGNTIATDGEAGIVINPGMGGASENLTVNFTILNNHISGSQMGIAAIAADVASDYFGITDPIYYSDNNSIENLIIAGNTIERTLEGIVLASSADGDRNNIIQKTLITNNQITGGENWGIVISSGGNGGSERSTSGNVIYNTTVRCNLIHGSEGGISIISGEDPEGHDDKTGTNDNEIGMIEISDNEIRLYRLAAIQIIGGIGKNPDSEGAFNNAIEDVLITRNVLETSSSYYSTFGLEIIGGWGNSAPTEGNSVQNISILTNSIKNNFVGIAIFGGKGELAKNNIVNVSVLAGNVFSENNRDMSTPIDLKDATGNEIEIPNSLP